MTQREKILLIAVVGVLVAWFGWRGVGQYQAAISDRREALFETETERNRVNQTRLLTQQAMQNLETWQQQSLPASLQVAQTDYRAWLQTALGEAGLNYSNVRRIGLRQIGEAATSISFMAHAEGDLKSVTQFLYSFYDVPQLHKLAVLRLTPLDDKGTLAMDITVEALVVKGTTRTEGVAMGTASESQAEQRQQYVESIVSRNIFEPYSPPPPPKPEPKPVVVERKQPPKPKFDDAKHAFVTALIGTGQGPQAWINVRTTGKTLYLEPGDEIEVGEFKGRLKAIDLDARKIVIESDGQTLSVKFGANLRDAAPAG